MIKEYIPEAGDVVWVNLDPRVGHEQSGHRPALILSTVLTHRKTGIAVVCPITSKNKNVSFELPFSGNKVSGSLLVLHVRSIDFRARSMTFIEKASRQELQRARRAIGLLIEINTA